MALGGSQDYRQGSRRGLVRPGTAAPGRTLCLQQQSPRPQSDERNGIAGGPFPQRRLAGTNGRQTMSRLFAVKTLGFLVVHEENKDDLEGLSRIGVAFTGDRIRSIGPINAVGQWICCFGFSARSGCRESYSACGWPFFRDQTGENISSSTACT